MCFFGSDDDTPTKTREETIDDTYVPAVQETDSGVTAARDNAKRRKAASSGRQSTMLTGGSGSTGATVTGKTLLGQ